MSYTIFSVKTSISRIPKTSLLFIVIAFTITSTILFLNHPSQQYTYSITKFYKSISQFTLSKNGKEKELNCDLFEGGWVRNPSGAHYTNETCNVIQAHQNCMKNGRPDMDFTKWKWKPNGCEMEAFDPLRFLDYMRGKSLAFVGDSVARNHAQSLICLLSRVTYPTDTSNTTNQDFRRWEYKDYNFNMSIFWSPYLIHTQKTDPTDPTSPFNLFLDEFDQSWTTEVEKFNYLIISAGQWFFRPTMFYVKRRLIGCLYCSANITHYSVDFSYRFAFRTAFKAINSLKEYKGVTFLRTYAPSHFENGKWNEGGNCPRKRPYKRNEILLDDQNLEINKIQLQEFGLAKKMGRENGLKFRVVNVTHVMLLRPDGHPGKYVYEPGKINGYTVNDCVHWCLPGPIDTWNDFLFEMLMRESKMII